MSFDLVCQSCGAPSSPATGVCPYCKSTMASKAQGKSPDSPTITKLNALIKEGHTEKALFMAQAAEKTKPALLKKANFVIAYVQVLFEVDAPSSKIRSLLSQALLEHPDDSRLSEYLEIMNAQSQLTREKNDAGEVALKSVLRQNPDNAYALFILGSHLYWMDQEPTQALIYLSICVQLHPNFLRANACLGAVYKDVGLAGAAKKQFVFCAKLEKNKKMKSYFKELAEQL